MVCPAGDFVRHLRRSASSGPRQHQLREQLKARTARDLARVAFLLNGAPAGGGHNSNFVRKIRAVTPPGDVIADRCDTFYFPYKLSSRECIERDLDGLIFLYLAHIHFIDLQHGLHVRKIG